MADFLTRIPFDTDDYEAVLLRELVLTALKSLLSSALAAMSGLEIPAMSLLRDVIEVELLLRYFVSEGPKLEKERMDSWLKADRRGGLKDFRPVKLRREIASGDSALEARITADYQGHCELGTHPTPLSLAMLRTFDGKTDIAPTYRPEFIDTAMSEVAFHAERVARFVAFLGWALEIGDENASRFEAGFRRLQELSSVIEKDRVLALFLLATRTGDVSSMRKHARQLLVELQEARGQRS